MGLMDLFRRAKGANLPLNETRAVAMGYTADLVAARAEWLSGRSNVAELTATVQTCVGLWESAFAIADVFGTDLLDRRSMAMMGRSLALRGEAMFLIRDRLLPITDWDMKTRGGEPTAYRVSVSEVGGGQSETVLAAEVLHVRIGSSPVTPWAGTAPLHRASLTAEMLQEVEAALRDVYRDSPIGSQVVPFPEAREDDLASMARGFRGRRGGILMRESVHVAAAGGPAPSQDWTPQGLTPDLGRAMPREMLAAARGSIMSVYGILPAMWSDQAQGPLVREAQRHLAQLVIQPMLLMVAEEASGKLGLKVTLDAVRPMQAFDAGGKARALATMIEALARAKEAGLDTPTLNDALDFIDWKD